MKKIHLLFYIILIACSSQATQQSNNTSEVPLDEVNPNTAIYLQESVGMGDIYDATGVVSLVLVNKSDSTVLIPSDFGAVIYVQEGSKWKEVENLFGYSEGEIVLPPSEEYPPGLVVLVEPDLTHNTDRPLVLRITVTGVLSDSGEQVEAYYDVTIK